MIKAQSLGMICDRPQHLGTKRETVDDAWSYWLTMFGAYAQIRLTNGACHHAWHTASEHPGIRDLICVTYNKSFRSRVKDGSDTRGRSVTLFHNID